MAQAVVLSRTAGQPCELEAISPCRPFQAFGLEVRFIFLVQAGSVKLTNFAESKTCLSSDRCQMFLLSSYLRRVIDSLGREVQGRATR